jgi:AAHS family 4-hydroxybenzoate transporter-like MFS transporter
MQNSIDVARLIDERSMSRVQWLVVAGCAVSMFIDGYGIQVMALAVPSLANEWAIEPSRFGFALSAVLLGLGLGAAFVAPLGDRLGRRTLLVGALALGGIGTLASATASSPEHFVVWRLLTGVGIGASVPNCNAWTSEYTPVRGRATLLVLMNAAVGIGAFSAGLIAPEVLSTLGWRGTFLIGGAASLSVAALMYFAAPESLKFLVACRPSDPRIGAILKRLAPEIDAARLERPSMTVPVPRPSLSELLNARYRARTLVLWTVVLVNLFTLYFLISWLPTLLESAGWPLDAAVRGAVLIQAGGVVGGVLLSLLLNAGKTLPALSIAFLTAAICLGLFRFAPAGWVWTALLLLIGGGISGAQLSLNALSTAYYPPPIKATGMSWVGVVGTTGSVAAPIAGGWIIASGVASVNILAMMSIPPLLCAAGVLLMRNEWQTN